MLSYEEYLAEKESAFLTKEAELVCEEAALRNELPLLIGRFGSEEGKRVLEKFILESRPYARNSEVTIVVQVNGKLRGEFMSPADAPREELEKQALALKKIHSHIAGKTVKKVIVVPNKIVNIVVVTNE